MKEPRGRGTHRGARGNNQYAGSLARGWPGREVLGKGCGRVLLLITRSMPVTAPDVCFLVAIGGWSQPVDATPDLNGRDREYVLISAKCRQGLTAAEKPELWHRWQPEIL